jgi:hypothetical protein
VWKTSLAQSLYAWSPKQVAFSRIELMPSRTFSGAIAGEATGGTSMIFWFALDFAIVYLFTFHFLLLFSKNQKK